MEEIKEEVLSPEQQQVNDMAKKLLTPEVINQVFAGKRPEGMDYLVYKAIRKTLQDKTKSYLKGQTVYYSGKQLMKVTDKESDIPMKDGSGIKIVKPKPYVKPKNKEE